MENIYKRGFHGFVFNYAGMVGTALFKFLLMIVLVRILPVSDYGLYSLLMSIATTALLLGSFGVGSIWERYIPEYLEKSNFYILKRLVKLGILVKLLAGAVITAVFLVFGNGISLFLNAPGLAPFLPLLGIIVVFFMQVDSFQYLLDSLLEQRYKSLSNLLAFGTYFVLSYILLKMGFGLNGVLWAFLLNNVMIFLFALRKAYSSVLSKEAAGERENISGKVKNYGSNMYISSVGNIILSTSLDNFLISFFLGSVAVGLYSFGYMIIEGLFVFGPAVIAAPVILPIVIRKYTKTKDTGYLARSFCIYNKMVAFFSIPTAVGVLLLVDKAIIFIFQQEYLASIPVMFFYTIVFLIWTFGWPINVLLKALEMSKVVRNSRVFIAYNFVAAILLIPVLGILGAALATGTTQLTMIFYQLWKLRGKTELQYPWKTFGKIGLNTAVMAIILLILRGFITDGTSLLVTVAAGIVVYFGMALANRTFGEDKQLISQMSKLKILERF
jgi:O-antigen/teichoic acid export membrane protein